MVPVWRLGHPLWLAPHRPFFLLAGLWAALGPMVWVIPQGLGPEPLSWHRHELLVGMGGAAVGGYLLTALPAWTGGAPVSPAATRMLVVLWLAGRVAFVIGPSALLSALVDACYFLALGGLLSQAVLKARAWRVMPLALAPLLLGGFALVGAPELDIVDEYRVMRVLPLFFGFLISFVGGRAVAAFTIHWARRDESEARVADPRWMSRGALLALAAAIALLLADEATLTGPLLILSGMLQLGRMLPWRSWRTRRYPALLLLHLAWLWLALGLVMAGASFLPGEGLGAATGLHALTMGAMGTMTLAVMARAAMVRQDARLQVSWEVGLAFTLVILSALVRLCVPLVGPHDQSLVLQASVALWSGGWSLFLLDFRRALRGGVPRPVLSARTSASLADRGSAAK